MAVSVPRPPREAPEGIVGDGISLTERLSVARGRQLVYSPSADERMRAVDRLATAGTPEAIEALLEAMETGSPLARDPAGRLAVVRALAAEAGRPEVRSFLVREMMDAGARRDVTSGIFNLVRETAALALARHGDPLALAALSSAAGLRGPTGDAARSAWSAFPPRNLDPILFEEETAPEAEDDLLDEPGGKRVAAKADKDKPAVRTPRALSAPMLGLLGEIADVRAIGALRAELDRSDRPSRAAAALALAKIGDASIAPTVRGWSKESDPRFAVAAAEALVVLGDAEAPLAVKRALEIESVRPHALRLAYEVASPAVADPLVKVLPALEGSDAVRAVMALGRARAVKPLADRVLDAALGPAATSALGSALGAEADAAIEAGLVAKDAPRRRAFARAAVIRGVVLRASPAGLEAVLEKMLASKDAADVEVAAVGLVALGLRSPKDVLASAKGRDEASSLAVVAGAARGSLARGEEERAAFSELFAAIDPEKPSSAQIAAGVALLSERGAREIPFKVLLRLAEQGGPLAALAARALPARADETMRYRLLSLLEGGDPTVRVGLAMGLARSDNASASSWLARAYLREEDVLVRRALVGSLGQRSEKQRERALETARDLDPDPEVRALAARGLGRSKVTERTGIDPHMASLFGVERADGGAREQVFRVVLPNGLALPVVSARDGGLLIPGMPFGRATLELSETK